MAGGARSTVKPPVPRAITPGHKWLCDPIDGHIIGVLNPNANGEDFLPLPIPITQAQINTPPAALIDDIDATYQLNVAPFNRYRSNGSVLIGLDTQDYTYIQYGQAFYGSMIVTEPDVVIVEGDGELRVIENWPV